MLFPLAHLFSLYLFQMAFILKFKLDANRGEQRSFGFDSGF